MLCKLLYSGFQYLMFCVSYVDVIDRFCFAKSTKWSVEFTLRRFMDGFANSRDILKIGNTPFTEESITPKSWDVPREI